MSTRNKQIDFLRGIAIFLVLILHFNLSYHIDQSALNKIFSIDFINRLASNGNYGVTLFFVISGFLITSMSLERYGAFSKIEVASFYVYRFSRLMPCLLLALFLIGFLSGIHIPIFENDPHSTSWALAILSILTFWHNVLMAKVGYFNYCLNIYWSLSVEEVFYLTFPLLCLSCKKTRFIVPFWLVFIVFAPIYRSLHPSNEIISLCSYMACFDAIAIGCCSAIIARKIKFYEWRSSLQFFAGFMILAVYFYSGIMQNVVMGPSLLAIAAGVWLIAINEKTEKRLNDNFSRIVCWYGKNSYELYLFHIIVLGLMKEMVTPSQLGDYTKLLWMAVFFVISALISGAIATFYSQPMNNRLRKMWFDFIPGVLEF